MYHQFGLRIWILFIQVNVNDEYNSYNNINECNIHLLCDCYYIYYEYYINIILLWQKYYQNDFVFIIILYICIGINIFKRERFL